MNAKKEDYLNEEEKEYFNEIRLWMADQLRGRVEGGKKAAFAQKYKIHAMTGKPDKARTLGWLTNPKRQGRIYVYHLYRFVEGLKQEFGLDITPAKALAEIEFRLNFKKQNTSKQPTPPPA